MSAVDGKGRTRHVGAGIGAEEQERAVEIRRLAEPALWDSPDSAWPASL